MSGEDAGKQPALLIVVVLFGAIVFAVPGGDAIVLALRAVALMAMAVCAVYYWSAT